MTSLIRARDFEMERLSKACENELSQSVENAANDEHSYNLSVLNEKLRVIYFQSLNRHTSIIFGNL